MRVVRIEHRVPSYERWKQAFDADPADRKGSGVRRYRILRAHDDPDDVLIDLEFADAAEAEAFLHTMERIWSGPGKAVMQGPRARMADLVEAAELEARPRPLALDPIGIVRSPYLDTAQVPRGLGAQHEAEGVLELRPGLEPGLTDIEGFSHLYVIWVFDRSEGCDLLTTPPADDRPHGVFATRSPRRPNPLGLTVVRLLRREGARLHVRGVDMLDGTPIVDLKPYLSSLPAEELRRGWLAEAEARGKNRDAAD